MNKLLFLVIIALMLKSTHAQTVNCIKYINSTYANMVTCQSSSTDTRPINATATVEALKNITWYGDDDWNTFIYRNGTIVRDLYYEQHNCFMNGPVYGSLISGKIYEFSVKCTMLLLKLQKGDVVYFDIFEVLSHKSAQCSFFVPIPGYSSNQDVTINQQIIQDIQRQAQELKNKRKQNNLNIQQE